MTTSLLKTAIGAGLILTLAPSSVSAQDRQDAPLYLRISQAAVLGAMVDDIVSTRQCLAAGREAQGLTFIGTDTAAGACHEVFPLLRFAGDDPDVIMTADMAMTSAGLYAIDKWIGREHPKWATVINLTWAAARAIQSNKNRSETRRLERHVEVNRPFLMATIKF